MRLRQGIQIGATIFKRFQMEFCAIQTDVADFELFIEQWHH
ncbi:Uncharacterised protein [Vibrio cholerae]|uniref:Uncharacterized protein n=1 Tax=Vibrio cholerae TaxID=666 RepID=A0A655XGQ3_VIBCL|nr:Uncharacterised protein [Vibrio cholerae]